MLRPLDPKCGNPHCLGVVSSYREDLGKQGFERCDDCARFETDDEAITWLHENFHKLRLQTVTKDVWHLSLESLDMSTRLRNNLRDNNLRYVWQVVILHEHKLEKRPGFERRTVNEMQDVLKDQLGLELGQELPHHVREQLLRAWAHDENWKALAGLIPLAEVGNALD